MPEYRGKGRRRERTVRKAPTDPVEQLEYAKEVVLSQLNDGARTAKQLYDKLASKEVDPDIAESVIERFTELGLINDAEFAHRWVQSRHTNKGLGKAALRQELRRKGVDDDLIVEALEDVSADDEYDRAYQLAVSKLPPTRGMDPSKRVQRVASMLARKGYSSEVCFKAVRNALREEDENLDLLPPSSL